MFAVVITEKGGAQRRMEFDKSEVTIGRVQGNDIILPKGNVSKRHSRVVLKDNRFIVVDLKSTNGTYVNGRKITSPLVVKPGDKVYIGDFILTVEDLGGAAANASAGSGGFGEQPSPEPVAPPQQAAHAPPAPTHQAPMSMPQPEAHAAPAGPAAAPRLGGGPPPLGRSSPPSPMGGAAPQPPPLRQPAAPEPAAPPPPAFEPSPSPPARAGRTLRGDGPSRGDAPGRGPAQAAPPIAPPPAAAPSGFAGVMAVLRTRFDCEAVSHHAQTDPSRRAEAEKAAEAVIDELAKSGGVERNPDLVAAAVAEAVGLGALDAFIDDDSVREIVIEGPQKVVVDRGRGLMPTDAKFSSAGMLSIIGKRLVARGNDRIDVTRPILQTVLASGAHATVVLPPVAVGGPIIEVRRSASVSSASELVQRGVLDQPMLDVLKRAVNGRRNVTVVGPVGSGVTTLLGALAGLVDEDERIVAVAEVPDVALHRDQVVALSGGGPGSGVSLADVARQAAQLRCDRLVVDGVAGSDAHGVLAALAARGSGSFLGVHGPTTENATATLLLYAKLSGSSESALNPLIAHAVQVVVQVDRTELGHRVVAISEVSGANGSLETHDLFRFRDGTFNTLGQPTF